MNQSIIMIQSIEAPTGAFTKALNKLLHDKPEDAEVIAVSLEPQSQSDKWVPLSIGEDPRTERIRSIKNALEVASTDSISIADTLCLYPACYWTEAKQNLTDPEALIYNAYFSQIDGNGFSQVEGFNYRLNQITGTKTTLTDAVERTLFLFEQKCFSEYENLTCPKAKRWNCTTATLLVSHSDKEPDLNVRRSSIQWGRATDLMNLYGIEKSPLGLFWETLDKKIDSQPDSIPYDRLTIATTIKNNPVNFLTQLHNYAGYSEDLLDRLTFLVVDDGSEPALERPEWLPDSLQLQIERLQPDLTWTIVRARNWGRYKVRTGRVFFIDSDMILTEAEALKLLEYNNSQPIIYYPKVFAYDSEGNLRRERIYANQFLARTEDLKEIGGYNLEFNGNYGYEDRFLLLEMSDIVDLDEMNVDLINLGKTGKGQNPYWNSIVFKKRCKVRLNFLLGQIESQNQEGETE